MIIGNDSNPKVLNLRKLDFGQFKENSFMILLFY